MLELTLEHMRGKLYNTAEKYLDEFLTGGCQRLQRLLGSELYYKEPKNRIYHWHTDNISKLTIQDLISLCNKIEQERKKAILKNRTAVSKC